MIKAWCIFYVLKPIFREINFQNKFQILHSNKAFIVFLTERKLNGP